MIQRIHLPLRPAWRLGESLAGYIERLFATNGHRYPTELHTRLRLIHCGCDPADVVRQCEALFDVLGVPFPRHALQHWLKFRRAADGTLLSLDYGNTTAACSSCLTTLGFRPAYWDLPLFGWCPVHGRSMHARRRFRGGHVSYTGEELDQCMARLSALEIHTCTDWLPPAYDVPVPQHVKHIKSLADLYAFMDALIEFADELDGFCHHGPFCAAGAECINPRLLIRVCHWIYRPEVMFWDVERANLRDRLLGAHRLLREDWVVTVGDFRDHVVMGGASQISKQLVDAAIDRFAQISYGASPG